MSAIRTPDQRLRVFVSSTLRELADERAAARRAVERLRLIPVMFELAARPHAPQSLYRAYLDQSHVFVGIYWQSYGWVGPGMSISGLEDEFRLAGDRPRLLYIREPAPDRDPRLTAMLAELETEGQTAYKHVADADELQALLEQDLAVLLSERFEAAVGGLATERTAPRRGFVIHPDNPLLGRSDELADVMEQLAQPSVRLVTLTGPPGSGKSRVALELGALLAASQPDGVWEVLLEDVPRTEAGPDPVLEAIATAVGAPSVAELADHLHGWRALLVLDAVEGHAASGPAVAELLAQSPSLRVLATSRESLRLRGEHEVVVGPLPVGDGVQNAGADVAVRLLLDRVRAVDPSVVDTDETVAAAREVCRRVDGLPLLLELAAARTRVFPLPALAEALDDPLRVLAAGAQDLPARHRSLAVLLDASHDLLSEDERTVLRRLSSFDGGWPLSAADEVVMAAGPVDVDLLDALDGLLARHLVRRRDGPGGELRFDMLATTRAYARRRLGQDVPGELAATCDAHARWVGGLAERARRGFDGPDQIASIAALHVERDNLAVAAGWLEGQREHDALRVICLAGAVASELEGRVGAGEVWVARGLAASEGRHDALAGRLLGIAAALSLRRGDVARAVERCEDALLCLDADDDPTARAVATHGLGRAARRTGDLDRAAQVLQDGVRAAEAAGAPWLTPLLLAELAGVEEQRGAAALANTQSDRGRRIADSAAAPATRGRVLLEEAWVALHRGDGPACIGAAAGAADALVGLGDRWMLSDALLLAAAGHAVAGERQAAARVGGAAEALRGERDGPSAPPDELATSLLTATHRTARREGHSLAWDDAWAQGTATAEEVVAEVVASIGSPGRPRSFGPAAGVAAGNDPTPSRPRG